MFIELPEATIRVRSQNDKHFAVEAYRKGDLRALFGDKTLERLTGDPAWPVWCLIHKSKFVRVMSDRMYAC